MSCCRKKNVDEDELSKLLIIEETKLAKQRISGGDHSGSAHTLSIDVLDESSCEASCEASCDASCEASCPDKAECGASEDLTEPVAAKKTFAKGDRVFIGGRFATIKYGPDSDREYMAIYDDDGRQSRFLKADLIEKAPLLELDSKDAIRFGCDLQSSFIVSNVSSGHVAFRVLTTAPKQYIVRPARATLRPRECIQVQISSKQGQPSSGNGFLIMATAMSSCAEIAIRIGSTSPRIQLKSTSSAWPLEMMMKML